MSVSAKTQISKKKLVIAVIVSASMIVVGLPPAGADTQGESPVEESAADAAGHQDPLFEGLVERETLEVPEGESVVRPEGDLVWVDDVLPADDLVLDLGDEVEELRDEFSQTFETEVDGVYVTELSSAQMHTENAAGDLVDVDLSLEPTASGDFESVAAPVDLVVADDGAADALVTLDRDRTGEEVVSFGLDGATSVTGELRDRGVVRFEEIIDGVDLEIEPMAAGVKETIYLAGPEADRDFLFPMDLPEDWALTGPNPAGHVEVLDESGQIAAYVPRAWMEDADLSHEIPLGNRSDDLVWEVVADHLDEQAETGWALRLQLDQVWLDDSDRVWPVRVDPSLTFVGGADGSNTSDTYITSWGLGFDHSLETEIRMGWSWFGTYRALVKPAWDATLDNKRIHHAALVMEQSAETDYACVSPTPFRVLEITEACPHPG